MSTHNKFQYTPNHYIHGAKTQAFASIVDFAKSILNIHLYPNNKHEIHFIQNDDNSLTVYVCIDLGDKQYDLDILHFIEVKQDSSYWDNVKNSKHHYCFTYLSINHNPHFLTAPLTFVENLLQCQDRFTNGGKRWLAKMVSVLKSIQNRKEYKDLLLKNAQFDVLMKASLLSERIHSNATGSQSNMMKYNQFDNMSQKNSTTRIRKSYCL